VSPHNERRLTRNVTVRRGLSWTGCEIVANRPKGCHTAVGFDTRKRPFAGIKALDTSKLAGLLLLA
jgi:hypothetical protein